MVCGAGSYGSRNVPGKFLDSDSDGGRSCDHHGNADVRPGRYDTLTITAPVLTSIAVTPATAQIYQGATQQFTATGTFSDNSTQNLTSTVTWGTSNGAVATISTSGATAGLTSGVGGGGPIGISATFGSIVSTTTGGDGALTVVGITSIVVTPATPTGLPR